MASPEASYASAPVKKARTGVHCIAPGCVNYFYKTSNVHYHRMPTDERRVKQWLQVLKRKTVPDLKHARVCSEHFADEDYEFEGCCDGGPFFWKKTARLKDTACPTIIDFSGYKTGNFDCPTSSTSAQVTARAARSRKRREKKEMIESTSFLDEADTSQYSSSEEVEQEVPTSGISVGCQTEPLQLDARTPIIPTSSRPVQMVSVSVATDDVEAQCLTVHDHPYSISQVPPDSPKVDVFIQPALHHLDSSDQDMSTDESELMDSEYEPEESEESESEAECTHTHDVTHSVH